MHGYLATMHAWVILYYDGISRKMNYHINHAIYNARMGIKQDYYYIVRKTRQPSNHTSIVTKV